MRYYICVHTRACPNGFHFQGFNGAPEPLTFATKEEAFKYLMKYDIGWRWNGYCTVEEFKGA